MRLSQILQILYKIHKSQPNISMPYICGGIPRDKLIGSAKSKYDDLDITTGDASVRFLAEEFSLTLSKKFDIEKKIAKDGHVSVKLANLKVDFSSNFIVPGIDELLAAKGIESPSDLQKEMFSRDFTCNALLLHFNLRDILDPTGLALKDIENKVIKTCLDPKSTFIHNVQRIPRVYYVAAKLGFEVDPAIIAWIKDNGQYFAQVEAKYSMDKISKAMEFDRERTIQLLDATNGWQFVPGLQQTITRPGI